MRLFIDTNIIVEYIEHRQQYDSVPIGISRTDMLNAVFNHDFNDLEDSFQFQTAAQNRCGTIITINIDDYKNADRSRMEILTPSAFVEKYINE
jgi:predicted nucleic acid-binding protein